uniref:Uncharacterized protein n=1 Tax=Arundo donax TaxID=35708 RepID=A0A0A9CE18_ARUDO
MLLTCSAESSRKATWVVGNPYRENAVHHQNFSSFFFSFAPGVLWTSVAAAFLSALR